MKKLSFSELKTGLGLLAGKYGNSRLLVSPECFAGRMFVTPDVDDQQLLLCNGIRKKLQPATTIISGWSIPTHISHASSTSVCCLSSPDSRRFTGLPEPEASFALPVLNNLVSHFDIVFMCQWILLKPFFRFGTYSIQSAVFPLRFL